MANATRKKHLPCSWDPALEDLLNTSLVTNNQPQKISWNEKTLDNYNETKTFLDAVNKHVTAGSLHTRKLEDSNNSIHERELKIRRMIQRPPSPRKEIVIPNIRSNARIHDTMGVERVMRERAKLSVEWTKNPISILDNSPITRKVNVSTRAVTYAPPPKHVFYWGI